MTMNLLLEETLPEVIPAENIFLINSENICEPTEMTDYGKPCPRALVPKEFHALAS